MTTEVKLASLEEALHARVSEKFPTVNHIPSNNTVLYDKLTNTYDIMGEDCEWVSDLTKEGLSAILEERKVDINSGWN